MPRSSQLDPFRPSLALWITLGTLGSAMSMLVLLLILINNFSATYARQRAISEVHLMADNVIDTLKWRQEERIRDLSLLASWPNFRQQTTAEQRETLTTMVEKTSSFHWLSLTDSSGKIRVASNPALEGQQLPKHDGQLPSRNQVTISLVHRQSPLLTTIFARDNASPLQYEIAIPFQQQGQLDGWLVASLSWSKVEELTKTQLAHKDVLNKADLLILDQDGKVLLSSRDPKLQQVPASLRQQDEYEHSKPKRWPDGQSYITAIRNTAPLDGVQQPQWQIVVRQPLAIAMQDFSRLQDQLALSALIAFGALSIAAVWLARKIASPLRAIRRALETPGTPLPHTRSYAEAELLSDVITEMRQLEQQDIQALEQLNQTLEMQVAERTRELDNVLQHAMNAFISLNEQGEVIAWNIQARQLFGWPAESLIGHPLPIGMVTQQQQNWLNRKIRCYQQTKASPALRKQHQTTLFDCNGEPIAVELNTWISATTQGFRFNVIIQDIRQRRAIEQALRNSQLRLQTITDNLPVLIAYIDRDLRFQFNNATYALWYQWPINELQNRQLQDLYPPEEYANVLPFMQQALAGMGQRFERTEQRPDGLHYLMSIYIPHHQDEQVVGFYVLTQDITKRKQLELELEQLALFDALTGLPNRRALMDQLPKAMARCARTRQSMALLFMDLDGFKAVNDTYGHDAGDEVLQQFAQRIQSHLRGTDTLFRLGGDEFTLILENLADEAQGAEHKAQQLLETMQSQFELTSARVSLSSSIGIALYQPASQLSSDELLTLADGAMYQAKHAGKNRFVLAASAPPSPIA